MREEFAATAPVVAPAITPEPLGRMAAAVTPASGNGGGGSMRFLTQVIVDLGFAPRERVEAAMLAARDAGTTPDQLLVDQGVITAEQRARAIAERLGLDFLDLSQYRLDMAAVNLLPADVARRCELVPVAREGEHTLVIAMADPANVVAIDDVEIQTGMSIQVAVATREDILAVIANMTRLDSSVTEVVDEDSLAEVEMFDVHDAATETPIVKLVNALLSQAVTHGASDVHFEAEAREMRVRIRVDGVLEEIARIPARMVPGVVSRIKIMCELDISERRLPQDGRVGLNVDGKQIDIRVVTLPTVHGESVVMRILDRSNVLIEIPKLGLDEFSLGPPERGDRARSRLRPRHRPHRIRKVHDALCRPQLSQHVRQEHRHHRGSRRVPAGRRHPGRRQRTLGADVRHRVAGDDAC